MPFQRHDGFVGAIPQKFIDNNFPKCPMCKSIEPQIMQHLFCKMSQK